ncbi:hypothetical protein BU17DRAFT_60333 [Hysterangium stoloniferum]|nr:hypothetical protein BU17DRAFT_60333 [Hysterangium stoloniferum]
MFIRVWESIGSMVDLFSIVGQIEKHFGRVLDFTAPRDSDVKGTRGTIGGEAGDTAVSEEVKVIDVKIGTQMSQQGGAERVLAGTLKTSNISSSSSHLSPESSHIDASTLKPLVTSTHTHTHARESTPASQPPLGDTPLSTAPPQDAVQPTLSKREWMLLAVRQAGAAGVSSRKERGEMDSTGVWRYYAGTKKTQKWAFAKGLCRPENTRNAESEGSEKEKQSPQETETMEATSWWRKMTRFRK